jgi:hypothetical protein
MRDLRQRRVRHPLGRVEGQAGSLPRCDPAAIPIDLAIAEPQGSQGGVIGFPALRPGAKEHERLLLSLT